MEFIKRYTPDELAQFELIMSRLILALEHVPDDVLGRTFIDLELHNKYAGRYLSPYPLCRMIAKLNLFDDIAPRIGVRGFVTVQEPAAGLEVLVIAVAQEMLDAKISYQQHLHATTINVHPKCVRMDYLQFSSPTSPPSLCMATASRWK